MSRSLYDKRQYSYWYLASNPCVDCGETDPVVLQFDHRGDHPKVANVSWLVKNGSYRALIQEIKKCDVRCANCHTRKTARDQNWYSGLLP